MMEEPLLEAKNLVKTYPGKEPLHLLKGVSLKVFAGDAVAIMGASGEGKTTLLHILGTLESFSSGELFIAGKSADSHSKDFLRRCHFGFIFQNYNLLEDYTTLQNILIPASISRKETHSTTPSYLRALTLLDKVGLLPKAHLNTKHLSGGEKQRAAIARALMNDPEMILADEPSGNLDYTTSMTIHNLLLDCAKQFNKGLIIVTHDEKLAALCDHLYVLQNGQLLKTS